MIAVFSWAACGPEGGGSDSAQGSGTTQPADTDGMTSQGPGGATSQGSSGEATSQGSAGGSTGQPENSTGATSTSDATTDEPAMCRREAHAYQGCPTDWPTMTAIEGWGETRTMASFGVFQWVCKPGNNWNGMVLGDPADPPITIGGWSFDGCGPEGWFGEHATKAFAQGVQPEPVELDVTITIDGFAGDWDNEVPAEPARIFGHLSGDLVGPFEAIRCDLLDQSVDNCG